MKYLNTFENYKLNETGEWSSYVDWEYVKSDPVSTTWDENEISWIKYLDKQLNKIKSLLNNENDLDIIDIKGFDKYQGPYAKVEIKNRTYNIWTMEYDELCIEDFEINNSNENDGFKGNVFEIAEVINNL